MAAAPDQPTRRATDIGEEAIIEARAGLYPLNIGADVSPERLQRFFVKEESGYRIKRSIEIAVSFADGDFIDGDLLEPVQLGAGKASAQAPFLDVLDDVPTHPEMPGHIFDGHVPGQFQGIACEVPGVAAPPRTIFLGVPAVIGAIADEIN